MNNTSRAEKAVACFNEGLSCSQAILSSFVDEYGLDKKLAGELAAEFGGWMGRMGQTCGAVIGAYVVIGLKNAAITGQDTISKDQTHLSVQEFSDRFKARNHSLTCKELLDCDISTPEGLDEAKQRNLFKTICPKFIRDAVEILEEMM